MLGQGHGKRMHRAPLLPLLCPTLRDPWAVRPTRTRSSPRCRQALGPQHEPCLSPLCTRVHVPSSPPSTNPAQHLTQSFLGPCLDSGPPFNVMSALPPWASAVWLPYGASFCRPLPTAPQPCLRLHLKKPFPEGKPVPVPPSAAPRPSTWKSPMLSGPSLLPFLGPLPLVGSPASLSSPPGPLSPGCFSLDFFS